jgi:hypothetical protein
LGKKYESGREKEGKCEKGRKGQEKEKIGSKRVK